MTNARRPSQKGTKLPKAAATRSYAPGFAPYEVIASKLQTDLDGARAFFSQVREELGGSFIEPSLVADILTRRPNITRSRSVAFVTAAEVRRRERLVQEEAARLARIRELARTGRRVTPENRAFEEMELRFGIRAKEIENVFDRLEEAGMRLSRNNLATILSRNPGILKAPDPGAALFDTALGLLVPVKQVKNDKKARQVSNRNKPSTSRTSGPDVERRPKREPPPDSLARIANSFGTSRQEAEALVAAVRSSMRASKIKAKQLSRFIDEHPEIRSEITHEARAALISHLWRKTALASLANQTFGPKLTVLKTETAHPIQLPTQVGVLHWEVLREGWWRSPPVVLTPISPKGPSVMHPEQRERLELLASLKPLAWYRGSELGKKLYYVAVFNNLAVADSADYGNALYYVPARDDSWMKTFRASKREALKMGARRLVHKGSWQSEVKALVRRTNAGSTNLIRKS